MMKLAEMKKPRNKLRTSMSIDPSGEVIFEPIFDFGFKPFSKTDYEELKQLHREEFIFRNFSTTIKKGFEEMKGLAKRGLECNYTFVFELSDYVDIQIAQSYLEDYFLGLGYQVFANSTDKPSKEIHLLLK